MEIAIPWYDPKTETWLTYSGEFNSLNDARESLKTTKERE